MNIYSICYFLLNLPSELKPSLATLVPRCLFATPRSLLPFMLCNTKNLYVGDYGPSLKETKISMQKILFVYFILNSLFWYLNMFLSKQCMTKRGLKSGSLNVHAGSCLCDVVFHWSWWIRSSWHSQCALKKGFTNNQLYKNNSKYISNTLYWLL